MGFSIGLRSLLLLIAMVQGLVIALLLAGRGARRRQIQDFFLAALLLTLACTLISYFIGFLGVYDYAREHGWDLTFFPFGNMYLIGPLVWLYVQALTDRQYHWKKSDAWHFAVPLAYFAINLGLWALPPEQKEVAESPALGFFDDLLRFSITVYYMYWSLKRLRLYRRLVDQEYSNTSRLALYWLRAFLYALSAYMVLELCFIVVNVFIELWYTGWFWLELSRAVLLYYLSVTGWAFAQKTTVVPFQTLERRESEMVPGNNLPASKPLFSSAELEVRGHALSDYMSREKPWLDPELTLSQLAAQTGLNSAQLSYLVNAGFAKNFNDFVNEFRVEEVKRKMNDPACRHLSLLGIAFECGFNSKATFNRAFKKQTGMAPTTFARG